MPLQELLPVTQDTAQWQVWGTTARLVVRDRGSLPVARAVVEDLLAAVDRAANRFRGDSELRRLDEAGGGPVTVSPLLATLVEVALQAWRSTDGDVDPSLGHALCDLGYDRDWQEITSPGATGRVRLRGRPRPGGAAPLRLDGRQLVVPAGVRLDLGATAKAWAADRVAALVADRLGTGVLLALGGDIATAGPTAEPGWGVLVQDQPGQPATTVTLTAGHALATSSTISRRWQQAGSWRHHVLDPRTGLPAPAVWRTVSVAAATCVEANTCTTAALVRGRMGVPWLRDLGLAARLVAAEGETVRLGGWPAESP